MTASELRNLPSVDKVMSDGRIQRFGASYPHSFIVSLVRNRIEEERNLIAKGNPCSPLDEIVDDILSGIKSVTKISLRPVINASGVLLHTNLGRAPLSSETIAAMEMASKGYCNVEFDLETGVRGSRHVHIEKLLCQLTGAEAALVVNNNAAAVMLMITVLARRKEVIVSRGEEVEIGGGFRIPDVMRQSGAKLVEVGTTNCTYASDYEQAITERTAALLRVHTSNFKVEGFTHTADLEELMVVSNKYSIPLFDDLGSGCFLDATQFGLAPEPMVQKSVLLGAGLACFSGDKLLGGPQSGIIVGKKIYVDKLKKHPLVRALRVDKTRLAGLAATLLHYLKGEAVEKVPLWRMVAMPLDIVGQRAHGWKQVLGDRASVVDGESVLGGGSLPGSTLPTRLLAIKPDVTRKGTNASKLLNDKLRQNDPPIIGRISGDVLLLDPRSVLPEDDGTVSRALKSVKHLCL